ncbi:DUF2523 family protein [Chitinivorax sp. PXF-14]|uniref:DUF2523 family protein n=1 Tax=Chitinivorax sp. PXF-14 TaxID=3230488 RepID=UPI003467D3FD
MSFVAIIISGLNAILGWLLRTIVIKFVFFTALFVLASEAISYLSNAGIFPDGSSISTALQSLSPSVWWGLDLFAFDIGFPMILSAFTLRWIIKFMRGM